MVCGICQKTTNRAKKSAHECVAGLISQIEADSVKKAMEEITKKLDRH